MNKKELAEIKRRFNLNHHNITLIRGCYINSQGQAIASFAHSLLDMPQEEAEKYLAIFRRTLSGEFDQNLLTIDFTPEQVLSGPEHGLLMALRDSALKDEELANAFFEKAAAAIEPEENAHYLILLLHDGYDVPHRGKDGMPNLDASNEVFHYILCSVCPVKLTKPALTYVPRENDFHNQEGDWAVGMPDMGFLFPCFDERAANIYNALYYTRDTAAAREGFISAVFGAPTPMPAAQQKEAFQAILQDTLGEDCSLEVMQAVQEQVMDRIAQQKEEKRTEPVRIEKKEVQSALADCGVTSERQSAFEEQFDREFGASALLSPGAVASPRQFQVKTPSVTINVAPDRSDLLETRMIDGHPYILIRAEEGVAVNGVAVNIQ